MLYWSVHPWVDACGGSQNVSIDDRTHSGGWLGTKRQDYQVADRWIDCGAGTARYHMRIFGSFVRDSHGTYGYWSIGDAHYDIKGHACSRYLDNAEARVRWAFKNDDGSYRWFVGGVWSYWANNSSGGTGLCSDPGYDGYGWKMNLIA